MSRAGGFFRELQAVLNLYNRANGPLLARALAFNLIVTAVPFIVIFFWLGTEFLKDSAPLRRMLTDQFRLLLPPDAAAILVKQITQGDSSLNLKGLGVIGIATLFWLPLSLFNSIQLALGEVNGFHETRGFFVRQIAGTFTQISLIVLLFAFASVSFGARAMFGEYEALYSFVSFCLSLIILFLTLTAIYRFSCRGVILREAARTAFAVAVLWQIVNRIAGTLVKISGNTDITYGILAGVVVLLTCSYFFAAMLLIGGIAAVRQSGRKLSVKRAEENRSPRRRPGKTAHRSRNQH